jgi:hypothetical protein
VPFFENSAERKIVTDLSTDKVKMDIRNSLRYLLITLRPLRGPSVGVQPPTDAEKSPA